MAPATKDLEKTPNLYGLSFKDAPLGQVISAITRDTDYNLAIDADIELDRPITVFSKRVTLEEALNMIVVNGAGYAWSIDEGVLRIKRFEERIYHFDYLDLTGETVIDVGGDMLASGVEDSGVVGKYQVKAKKPEQFSDVWAAVEGALTGIKTEDGILQINRNAGVIYMADTPRKVATMVKFLDSLVQSLHRQVFIEAKIMQVFLNDKHQYGIDWTNLNVAFTTGLTKFPDIFELEFNSEGRIARSDVSRFEAVLDFLRTQGDVTVLANPHIAVMNRQSAIFTVGFQFPYGDIDGVDRDLESGFVTFGTTIRRAILGLQLGITPQISGDGIITLHIAPTITRIQREELVEVPTPGSAPQVISNPVIDLQELATTVRVREGNSFVLAGLISKIKKLDQEGLPLFGDLPYIGSLFKRMETLEENSELVIFLTPYVKDIR
jgi:MSHA biogenesis protein MshL